MKPNLGWTSLKFLYPFVGTYLVNGSSKYAYKLSMKLARPIKIFLKDTYVQLRMNKLEDLGVDGIKYRMGIQW
jgi:hypothetical protein